MLNASNSLWVFFLKIRCVCPALKANHPTLFSQVKQWFTETMTQGWDGCAQKQLVGLRTAIAKKDSFSFSFSFAIATISVAHFGRKKEKSPKNVSRGLHSGLEK